MIRSARWVAVMTLFLVLGSALGKPAEPLEQVVSKADEILKLDNVSVRGNIGIVFDAADRLAATGALRESQRFYLAGLRSAPQDFRHHLAYAKVLSRIGHHQESNEEAQIVLKNAEDGDLVAGAEALAGVQTPAVQPLGKLPGDHPVLVLIPLGDVDVPLIVGEQAKLATVLGVAVEVRLADIKLPPADRDPAAEIAQQIRPSFNEMRSQDPEIVRSAMRSAGVSDAELKEPRKFLKVFETIMRDGGDANSAAQVAGVAAGDEQWEATKLLALLTKATAPFAGPNIHFIGIVNHDIYSEGNNFLYGWAAGGNAIVSYRRFTASFNNETPARSRLARRFNVQCLSSAGHVFGLARCTDPTCARAYPNDLEELDAKSERLCDKCKAGFRAALSQDAR